MRPTKGISRSMPRWLSPDFEGYTDLKTDGEEACESVPRARTRRCCNLTFPILERAFWIVCTAALLLSLVWYRTTPKRCAMSELNGLIPSCTFPIYGIHSPPPANEKSEVDATEVVEFPYAVKYPSGKPLQSIVNESMKVWDDLMPSKPMVPPIQYSSTWKLTCRDTAGKGFIALENVDKDTESLKSMRLPPMLNSPDSDSRVGYVISVFHQLHCLHSLQREFNNMMVERPTLEELGEDHLVHVYHCFDYVRRALMCASDTTLEGQSSGSTRPATKGEGAFHVCRKFDVIRAYAWEHRLSDL